MNKKNIQNAIDGALIADSYSLGAHWIYDEAQLKSLEINWNELNEPCAMWHKGKHKGDFTHYGDHTQWLLQFLENSSTFDIQKYAKFWLEHMQTYSGYIDGSSRETVEILQNDSNAVTGSSSHDLSIIGRIAPLLYVASSKDDFLRDVHSFISFTHNSNRVLKAGELIATLLYEVVNGSSIEKAILNIGVDSSLEEAFKKAITSKNSDSFEAIRNFGPACGVEGGFESVIHLLLKYDNYKEAMIANAKAGGDSAARGMIVGMMLGAANKEIPSLWRDSIKGL